MKRRLEFLRAVIPVVVVLAAVSTLYGQVSTQAQAPSASRPVDPLSFEVVSIKLHKGVVTSSFDPSVRGRRVTGTAITLIDLITHAYGVRYDQISGGPNWAKTDYYDINAKAEGEEGAGPLTTVESRQMVQTMLADRFRLKIHRETQEVPMYDLVVGKNGPKLKPSAPDATGGNFVRGTDKGLHMEATKGTMQQLARQLSITAGRPVVDKTGLAGYYTFTLDWFPANRIPPPDLDAPSMVAALHEQLGLRLEPAKGPIEKLVIEYAERPSEN
jgi:uncharacterized protein (TIGR03435 family)